jgi:hypothetical protein
MSAHQIANAEWGTVAITEAFLALLEVLRSLDPVDRHRARGGGRQSGPVRFRHGGLIGRRTGARRHLSRQGERRLGSG